MMNTQLTTAEYSLDRQWIKAKTDSRNQYSMHRKALGNCFLLNHQHRQSEATLSRLPAGSPDAGTVCTTSLSSRKIVHKYHEWQDQTSANGNSAGCKMDPTETDTIEAEYLKSFGSDYNDGEEDLYGLEEEEDLYSPGEEEDLYSPEEEDLYSAGNENLHSSGPMLSSSNWLSEFSSVPSTLVDLTFFIKRALETKHLFEIPPKLLQSQHLMTFSSRIFYSTCTFQEFCLLISTLDKPAYTSVIMTAMERIRQLNTIRDDEPVRYYGPIIQKALKEALRTTTSPKNNYPGKKC